MSSLPAGEGVGAEPGVDNTEVGLHVPLCQVLVVLPQLTRVKLSLVDDSPGGQRTDVEPHLGLGYGVATDLRQTGKFVRQKNFQTFLSMNIFFSSSVSSMSSLAGTTNTWLMTGSEPRATAPGHVTRGS